MQMIVGSKKLEERVESVAIPSTTRNTPVDGAIPGRPVIGLLTPSTPRGNATPRLAPRWTSRTTAAFAVYFYASHDAHASRGAFGRTDEALFNAMLVLHPASFRTVRVAGPLNAGALSECGAEFYY